MSNKKLLIPFYHNNKNIIEIGIDEAGRGPLFGRVYCAGVVFPNNIDLNFSQIKDSKKFTSQKNLMKLMNGLKKIHYIIMCLITMKNVLIKLISDRLL